ncbi:MAG: sulfatase-like hydrolase/transferase [Planctomycetota bacterium]
MAVLQSLLALLALVVAADQTTRPHILIIVIDALRADRVGCYGNPRPVTPNIDAFARQALVFDDAIAAASWTKPSIPSLFTGLYPSQHGVFSGSHEDARGAITSDVLAEQHDTLAEQLRSLGYRTAAFVENAQLKSFLGFDQGFDTYTDDAGTASEIVAKFLAWVRREPDRPYFAYLHLLDVHWPYQPAPPYDTRFGNTAASLDLGSSEWRALRDDINSGKRIPAPNDIARMVELYDGELAMTDAALGALFRALDDPAIGKEVFVLLTADHGEEFYEHGKIGHGHSLSETLLRIPFLCKAPRLAPGRTDSPASLVDVYPTVLELAAPDAAPARPGRSVLCLDARGSRTLLAETRPGSEHVLVARRYPMKLVRTYRASKEHAYVADLRSQIVKALRVEVDLDLSAEPWRVTKLTMKLKQTEDGVELRGPITSLQAGTLEVLRVRGTFDAHTRVLTENDAPAGADALRVGMVVEIDGDFAQDELRVKRIRVAKPDEQSAQIEARVEDWQRDAGRLRLARQLLELNERAAIKDKREQRPDDAAQNSYYRDLFQPQNLILRKHLEVEERLFDLSGDPGEASNIIDARPGVASALRAELDRYLEACARSYRATPTKTLDAKTIESLRGIGYVK